MCIKLFVSLKYDVDNKGIIYFLKSITSTLNERKKYKLVVITRFQNIRREHRVYYPFKFR